MAAMVVPTGVPTFHVPPIWCESRFAFELAGLHRSDVWRGTGVAAGDDRPVLLIPGFLAGDGSLSMMTTWLRRNGYRTRRAGIRANVGCSEAACLKLEQRLEEMFERYGEPVAIVGQSRGGLFAKALATRRPELVSGIVTLGSPLTNMLAVHPLVLGQIAMAATLGTLMLPGAFLSSTCWRGECCDRFRDSLDAPFPEDVGYMSVYSRSDGIVDWHACLDPEADEHLEVRASHCGKGVNAAVYRGVARALDAFSAGASDPGGAEDLFSDEAEAA
jgi:triacylglycerol lipase